MIITFHNINKNKKFLLKGIPLKEISSSYADDDLSKAAGTDFSSVTSDADILHVFDLVISDGSSLSGLEVV